MTTRFSDLSHENEDILPKYSTIEHNSCHFFSHDIQQSYTFSAGRLTDGNDMVNNNNLENILNYGHILKKLAETTSRNLSLDNKKCSFHNEVP